MSLDGSTESIETLATIGFDALQLFDDLLSVTTKDYQFLERDNLIGQQQRFDLWATNIGLHQRGHASLDYRFRDASDIHQYCQNLLENLTTALETCMLFSDLIFSS